MIVTSQEGRVLTAELSRPERLNALNSAVLQELREVVEGAASTAGIGCIVLRGAGDRAFCAGADLEEIRGLDVTAAQAFIRHGQRTMTAVAHSPVPVVAHVDGYALGGGFELVLASHLVVASDRSRLGLPEARIGCIPGFGGTQRLPQAVGKAAALHLMLSGEPVDADRAWQLGLLSVPPLPAEDAAREVDRLAHLIASGSRGGLANILDAARAALDPAALDHEAALAALSIASRDGQEGISSFAERRPPVFTEENS
ncbi:enoyl-CoA hydratase/isomerase family protein [Modestobacter sp. Leaf380]|uniref:enoyl-CoA hydratase/isomerase family protein n=1 Tax=Modestobacter sp. Leaf380 TaxID=1736356 RepID=UPI00191014BE|nr:enoyl-CoA hydratase/isomerase family protein [Modestobacter sp. Leaf380]